jgi:hypothetical protein
MLVFLFKFWGTWGFGWRSVGGCYGKVTQPELRRIEVKEQGRYNFRKGSQQQEP